MRCTATESCGIALDVIGDDLGAQVPAQIEELVLFLTDLVTVREAVRLVQYQEVGTINGDAGHHVDPHATFGEIHEVASVKIPFQVRIGTLDSDDCYTHTFACHSATPWYA
jgi:hypothetical protein